MHAKLIKKKIVTRNFIPVYFYVLVLLLLLGNLYGALKINAQHVAAMLLSFKIALLNKNVYIFGTAAYIFIKFGTLV